MISRFFIDRPIFASVLSILITLTGAISLFKLPIAQFPAVTPPTVQVDCNYPGASAQVVAESIATPIEQQVNGVEGMMYMSSTCTNDGSYSLTVTFTPGINLNMAQVLVQNRVSLALPLLPDVVKATGVTTRKRSPDILLTVNIYSPDNRYDQLYLSNYANLQVKDELARLEGVSEIYISGQRDYSMRIWLDPDEIASRNLTAGDIVHALREQNRQVAAGQLGQAPVPLGQGVQVPFTALGRLSEPSQFEDIIIKATPEGRVVRLKDVAQVVLAPRDAKVAARVDRRPSIGIMAYQLPDANAMDVAQRVLAKMEDLKRDFPEGITYQVSYDTTPYTRESIIEVFKTLFEAVILVAIVVLLFLQNWRSALIPLVAVPVAIVGTFTVMLAAGFSLNNLTLFGLVLAIGIVVDDAIVVVEAVEHHIEHGLRPHEATVRAMQQVSGPVIAVGLVLSAVFLPCAFISGVTGQFYRQFALTIAVSTMISTFNSLTLSPALAAILLRPVQRDVRRMEPLPRFAFLVIGGWLGWRYLGPAWVPLGDERSELVVAATACLVGLTAAAGWLFGPALNRLLAGAFLGFNRGFEHGARFYTRLVGLALRGSVIVLCVYVGLLGLTGWTFGQLPRGFVPPQDMGNLLINVQLPDAASLERTIEVMDKVEAIALDTEGIAHTSAQSGRSFMLNAYGSNFGSIMVQLSDFKERRRPGLHSDDIAARLRERYSREIPDAQIAVYGPSPIPRVGRSGGFKIMIEDRGDLGSEMLHGQCDNLVDKGNAEKGLTALFSVFRANVPQLHADIDREVCLSLGVPLKDAFDTLQIYLGSLYVNDFNLFGRTWQVICQAEPRFRTKVDVVHRLQVRNDKGEMVPLGAFTSIRETNGPLVLMRYNMYPAAPITGSAAPGVSSGDAIALMEKLSQRELPPSMSYEWTEMAYLEVTSGNTAALIFTLSVVMVFLVLAAQYESWALPLVVILVVPMCLLSALAGVALARKDINIFTQIGFVVLVGLASKNAILIVEFARALRLAGSPRRAATLEACRLRLRPIIMTSLAFILGVLPLLVSRGAGAEMRRTLGTAVFSGMLGVTLFGIFLTPVFFYVVDRLASMPFLHPLQRAAALPMWGLNLLKTGAIFGPWSRARASEPPSDGNAEPGDAPGRDVRN